MIKIIKIALLILLLAAIVFSIALTSIKMYVNASIKDKYANKVSYWKETVNCNIYLPFFSKKSEKKKKIDLLTSTQVFS